jgi:hypothetical protein
MTPERAVQKEKQPSESVLTEEGMQIERRFEQSQNADSPRMAARDPNSNATCESLWQSWRQDSEIVSIDDGIQIQAIEHALDEK